MYAPQVYPAVFPLSAVSAKDVSSVSAGFSACPSCEAGAGASVRQQEMTPRTCKKLVASAWQREGVYNRTGEPSVTFFAKEELRRACALIFVKKIGASDTKLAPTCLRTMKRYFRILPVRAEPSCPEKGWYAEAVRARLQASGEGAARPFSEKETQRNARAGSFCKKCMPQAMCGLYLGSPQSRRLCGGRRSDGVNERRRLL